MRRGRLRELDAISSMSTSGALNWVGTSAPASKTTSSSTRIVSLAATASWLRASLDCVLILDDIRRVLRRHARSYNCRQNRSERRKKGGNDAAVKIRVGRLWNIDRHNRIRQCDRHNDRMVRFLPFRSSYSTRP